MLGQERAIFNPDLRKIRSGLETRSMLGPCWAYVGPMLGLCWFMLGPWGPCCGHVGAILRLCRRNSSHFGSHQRPSGLNSMQSHHGLKIT